VTTASPTLDIGVRIATRLNETLGPKRYAMWFDRSAQFELDPDDRALRITVANKFLADGIGRQLHQQVCDAARQELGHDVRLDLGVRAAVATTTSPDEHTAADPRRNRSAATTPRPARSARRWRYAIDDFVVGPSNQLAFAAATRLAEHDDDPGSPLFIHGGCGLGKTHLLQGICKRFGERRPDQKVRYTTGEQFTNEYITAVRSNALDAFRRKIRRLDLLTIDDVHFLANKEKTQQEFLHCFNEIELGGARVVLVSDCHPKLIKQFSDALASRCVRGMVVRIDQPDPDTRLRLVEALAERRGLAVSEPVAHTIAQRAGGSVRDIEGILNKLQALSMLHHRTVRGSGMAQGTTPGLNPVIGHSIIDQLFQDQPDATPRKPVRYQAILDAVCDLFALPPEEVTGRIRKAHVVLARSLLIHLAYELTPMSYPEVAAAMGRPNHSTIITAAKRIKQQLKADKPVLLPGQPGETTPSRLLDQLRQAVTRRSTATTRD
jgi:chromosomal replication initiator protein